MEFKKYIKVQFIFNKKRYSHKIEKENIDTKTIDDTWFYYFNEGKYRFEVWGGYDNEKQPTTKNQFGINVYEIDHPGCGEIAQLDDIDVVECI